jgi:hypothetical protein
MTASLSPTSSSTSTGMDTLLGSLSLSNAPVDGVAPQSEAKDDDSDDARPTVMVEEYGVEEREEEAANVATLPAELSVSSVTV